MTTSPNVVVSKTISICAAHTILNHPGKCARPHGHNYKVEVQAFGQINPSTGMVVDFYDMKRHIDTVIEVPCDHRDLNQVYPDIITTAENLAVRWLKELHDLDARYCRVRVWETDTCYAEAAY
jgi:6-pyruvoyltetrahydropterin/6-carboxytetrahydropterin synthase